MRSQNLYLDLLDRVELDDTAMRASNSPTYAAACRRRPPRIETWAYPLRLGEAMPTLPFFLAADLAIPLDLEEAYSEICRALRLV